MHINCNMFTSLALECISSLRWISEVVKSFNTRSICYFWMQSVPGD